METKVYSSSADAESRDPIPSYKAGLLNSFRCAFRGIWRGVRTQRNVRIHLAMGVGVVALGAALKITALEWALLAVVISLVISMELANTAIEYLVDLVSPQYHPLAGAA